MSSNPLSGAAREALAAAGIKHGDSLEVQLQAICAAVKALQDRVETLENEGET